MLVQQQRRWRSGQHHCHLQQQQPSRCALHRRRGPTAPSSLLVLFLAAAAALLAAAPPAAAAPAADPRVAKLKRLEAASRDGLALFNEELFNELALSADRPYHLVVFGSAKRLMDSPKLQLRKLKEEFKLAAKAFKAGADADRIFFVDMWHDDASAVFARLGLSALPAVIHWSPNQAGKPGKKVAVPEAAKCGQGMPAYPWPAESIVDFIRGRTLLAAAPVDRPSFVKSRAFPLVALAALAGLAAVGWRLYNSPLVRRTWVWAVGSLLVYGFATSGGMYNIIRGVPLFYPLPGGRVKWWLDQRQGQLGAEGFVMGGSYILFSCCISAMVYGLPRVKDAKLRGGLSVAAAAAAAAVGRAIFAAYLAKTGMAMRSFFF